MNISGLIDDVLYSVAADYSRARSIVALGREIKADQAGFYRVPDGEAPPVDHVAVRAGDARLLVWRDPTRPELRVQAVLTETVLTDQPVDEAEVQVADTPVSAAITGSSKTLRKLNWSS